MTTATRSVSHTEVSSPASATASRAAITASWEKRSIIRRAGIPSRLSVSRSSMVYMKSQDRPWSSAR
jgi:hypothetical protein